MKAAPAAASLGFLLQGVSEELAVARAERDGRVSEGLGVSSSLEGNIANLKARYADLEQSAIAQGLDPNATERRYGRLRFGKICKGLGIEKAYLVNYGFASGYAHEKNLASGSFESTLNEERQFELGPVRESRLEAVADTLRYLFLAIHAAAVVVGDPEVAAQAEVALNSLEQSPDWPQLSLGTSA
jgi:hypothetical protein